MENQEAIYNERYPSKDFDKKTYSFNPQEIRNLTTFVTLTQMGKIAEVMANNFVSNEVIQRLGVKTTADTGILYDVGMGQIIIYLPKVICSECSAKRAEFKYKEKAYCKACVDLVTERDKKLVTEKPVEKVEVKEKKKKK